MLKIFTVFILCSALAVPLLADEIPLGRPSLTGFPHKQHQKTLGGCTECHGAKEPGPIAQFGENGRTRPAWGATAKTRAARSSAAVATPSSNSSSRPRMISRR